MPAVRYSFLCPTCALPTKVLETRGAGDITERRRECVGGHRFYTREMLHRVVEEKDERATLRKRKQHAPMDADQRLEFLHLIAINLARHTVQQGSTT